MGGVGVNPEKSDYTEYKSASSSINLLKVGSITTHTICQLSGPQTYPFLILV